MHDTITQPYPGQQLTVCGYQGGTLTGTAVIVEPHRNHLDATWWTLVVETGDGARVSIDTRNHLLTTPDYTQRGWCPECRTTREVTEVSDEGHLEARGEVGYQVTHYDCDHHTQSPATVVAAAPGAPYAGPSVAVARDHTHRALTAARSRQEQLDNPHGGDQ